MDNEYIAVQKNGKTYLHFYKGLRYSAVSLRQYPSVPQRVRLMNTGEALRYEVMYLPECFWIDNETMDVKYLHISGIDVDALESEPIVIEIEWKK